jgi:hypothetical protein
MPDYETAEQIAISPCKATVEERHPDINFQDSRRKRFSIGSPAARRWLNSGTLKEGHAYKFPGVFRLP